MVELGPVVDELDDDEEDHAVTQETAGLSPFSASWESSPDTFGLTPKLISRSILLGVVA